MCVCSRSSYQKLWVCLTFGRRGAGWGPWGCLLGIWGRRYHILSLCVCACFSGRSSVRQLSTFGEEKVVEEAHAKSTMITWKRIVRHTQKGPACSPLLFHPSSTPLFTPLLPSLHPSSTPLFSSPLFTSLFTPLSTSLFSPLSTPLYPPLSTPAATGLVFSRPFLAQSEGSGVQTNCWLYIYNTHKILLSIFSSSCISRPFARFIVTCVVMATDLALFFPSHYL